MAYVITEACATSKDTACWEACPVDAIHPGPGDESFGRHLQLYIDPTECIDCGACEPVCPVEAIYPEEDLPRESRQAAAANRDFFAPRPA
ncbi:4Fe-4S dicluster domain-containing protein [Streptomyces flavofungini]|uniref:4Fe-4S dicluster domain-containing protein n=1 Tax=Streptomyces flavofungini TaxID=68200 RepID=UPI0034DEB11F